MFVVVRLLFLVSCFLFLFLFVGFVGLLLVWWFVGVVVCLVCLVCGGDWWGLIEFDGV